MPFFRLLLPLLRDLGRVVPEDALFCATSEELISTNSRGRHIVASYSISRRRREWKFACTGGGALKWRKLGS